MGKLNKVINNPLLIFSKALNFKVFHIISDEKYLKMKYFFRTQKKLNLKNPELYNEKLQWLKLNDRKSFYTNLVDKFEVREYIQTKIGEKYLIPIYGVYNKFDDINFDTLPNEFVLKTTHDSGGVVICRNKNELNLRNVRKILEKSLKRNFYYSSREYPYKNVVPKIICEKLMKDSLHEDLKDYKLFCFNGEVKMIQVDFDRFSNHKRNYYDKEWGLLNLEIQYPNDPEKQIEKPLNFEKMISLAETLSQSHRHLRVDFYVIEEKIYFGELTFYHEAGFGKFSSSVYEKKLGDLISIN